jgi:hypothetical protein
MEKKAEEILEQDGPENPILEDLYDVSSNLLQPVGLYLCNLRYMKIC